MEIENPNGAANKIITLPTGYSDRVERFGFTYVPNFLIQHRKAMRLDIAEADLLLQLISRRGEQELGHVIGSPLETIAQEIGCAPATLHAAKNRLIKKDYLIILSERNDFRTNTYDLRPYLEKIDKQARINELFGEI